MIRLLALALILALASPVVAQEVVTSLGDRWYRIEIEPVTIPSSGITDVISICLDEIPGGIDGPGQVNVKPLDGPKNSVIIRRTGFFPAGGDESMMPYSSVVLEGVPGSTHRIKVIVRGKE